MANKLIKAIPKIAEVLVAVGALNWGFVKWFSFNLVEKISTNNIWTAIVYSIIGISGLIALFNLIAKKFAK